MMRHRWSLVVVLVALGGCAGDIMAPTTAQPADGVLVTVEVGGPCPFTCDPPAGGLTVTLITLSNTSDSTVFVAACQNVPQLSEQQLVNGDWTNVGPAVSCVQGPTSIAIPAHGSVQHNDFYAPGTRRLLALVSTNQSLAGSVTSTSASFEVP